MCVCVCVCLCVCVCVEGGFYGAELPSGHTAQIIFSLTVLSVISAVSAGFQPLASAVLTAHGLIIDSSTSSEPWTEHAEHVWVHSFTLLTIFIVCVFLFSLAKSVCELILINF